MSANTGIEWTDSTWNPLRGCTRISDGCRNCYAEGVAARFSGPGQPYEGLAAFVGAKREPRWTGKVALVEHMLDQPLRWRKPRRIFVNSMSDLFHESVPDEWIDRVFAVMALCPQHTFQVLTKRPERMREYFCEIHADVMARHSDRITSAINSAFLGAWTSWGRCGSTSTYVTTIGGGRGAREAGMLRGTGDGGVERLVGPDEKWFRCSDVFADQLPDWSKPLHEFGWNFKEWPLPNVWLGVSVEDQTTADGRIPPLLDTPAAKRFISAEPLLGPVDMTPHLWGRAKPCNECPQDGDCGCGFYPRGAVPYEPAIDWLIVGGESGPNARPMHPDWVRSLRDQCAAAGTAFFFKQWGEWLPGEANHSQFDEYPMHAYRRCDDHSYEWPRHAETQNFSTHTDRFSGDLTTKRVGKKAAGHLIDGREHREFPC